MPVAPCTEKSWSFPFLKRRPPPAPLMVIFVMMILTRSAAASHSIISLATGGQPAQYGKIRSDGLADSFVVNLNDQSIGNFISQEPAALLLFYAPWCHWCHEILPKFAEAATLLHSLSLPGKLAQIDVTMYTDVAQKYDIQAFPTLRFYLDGYPHEYSGGRRSKQDIMNWVTLHLETELILETLPQLQAFLESHRQEPALIAFIPSGGASPATTAAATQHKQRSEASSTERSVFVNVSRKLDHVGFAELSNRSLVHALVNSYDAPPSIKTLSSFVLMFNPHAAQYPETEKPVALYGGSLTDAAGLESFVKSYLFPALVDFDSDIATKAFTDGRPVWVLLTPSKDRQQSAQQTQLIERAITASRKLANEFRSQLVSIHSHSESIYDRRLYNVLGVEESDLPTIRVLKRDPKAQGTFYSTLKYRPDLSTLQSMDEIGLRRFLQGVLAGTLQPFVKSESPLAPEDNQGPVYSLVGEEFERLVLNSPQDIIVDFYAPWCGHCRKLEPAYREFGAALQPFKDRVRVMKIDATRNEVNLRIAGFPTIILFTPNRDQKAEQKKHMSLYSGDRSVQSMLNWLLREGSTKLTMEDIRREARRRTRQGLLEDESSSPWLVEEL